MKRSAWRYLWTSEDIRKKLVITLLLLILYRFAANIPVPGIDREVIRSLAQSGGATGTLFSLLDLLSGGTTSNFSILAMGVYPYITAQIILQLLVPIIPALERMMKDDPRQARKWMEKWTIIITIPMAALSAVGQINIFNSMTGGQPIIQNFGFTGDNLLPTLATLLSMMAGTMFGIWLGQLISEYGIPNQGLSLIIFSGIVAQIPKHLGALFADQTNGIWLFLLVVVILILTIFAIVFVQQGTRNVVVMFPGRMIGNRVSAKVNHKIGLMVNMAGMIPLIFAQSILTFPAIVASYFVSSSTPWVSNLAISISQTFGGGNVWYSLLYFIMVVAFTFFYTDVLFQQQNYGESLKKQGAIVPGISVGVPTQKYLTKVQRRITLPGALFLGLVAVLPYILGALLPIGNAGLFLISSAGLLIVVGVVRDTFNIIEAELKLHGYTEKLLKD